jgi:hypothetical protein
MNSEVIFPLQTVCFLLMFITYILVASFIFGNCFAFHIALFQSQSDYTVAVMHVCSLKPFTTSFEVKSGSVCRTPPKQSKKKKIWY